MSSHCSRYPVCGCPPDFGVGCQVISDDERAATIKRVKEGQTVMKTNGQSELIEVPNPDRYDLNMRKRRHKPTNFTPPKKKRKKK